MPTEVTLRLILYAGTQHEVKSAMMSMWGRDGTVKVTKPVSTVVLEHPFTATKRFNHELSLGPAFPGVVINLRRSTDAADFKTVLTGQYAFSHDAKNGEAEVALSKAYADLERARDLLVEAGWTLMEGGDLTGEAEALPEPEPVPTA